MDNIRNYYALLRYNDLSRFYTSVMTKIGSSTQYRKSNDILSSMNTWETQLNHIHYVKGVFLRTDSTTKYIMLLQCGYEYEHDCECELKYEYEQEYEYEYEYE
uniref:Uncharacterized protein n=1 Tax=Glossina pallidipes TaxID=7398 RepID=A0A1A9ZM06_GLOPL